MTRALSSFVALNLRRPSLLRGTVLVLGSFAAAFPLSGFPHTRTTLLLLLPATVALLGTLETLRCIGPRRDLHHAGVILCLFMDLLCICLILFFLLFPYVV